MVTSLFLLLFLLVWVVVTAVFMNTYGGTNRAHPPRSQHSNGSISQELSHDDRCSSVSQDFLMISQGFEGCSLGLNDFPIGFPNDYRSVGSGASGAWKQSSRSADHGGPDRLVHGSWEIRKVHRLPTLMFPQGWAAHALMRRSLYRNLVIKISPQTVKSSKPGAISPLSPYFCVRNACSAPFGPRVTAGPAPHITWVPLPQRTFALLGCLVAWEILW